VTNDRRQRQNFNAVMTTPSRRACDRNCFAVILHDRSYNPLTNSNALIGLHSTRIVASTNKAQIPHSSSRHVSTWHVRRTCLFQHGRRRRSSGFTSISGKTSGKKWGGHCPPMQSRCDDAPEHVSCESPWWACRAVLSDKRHTSRYGLPHLVTTFHYAV